MKEVFLTRFITAALFTAVIAGTWDAWWHAALGRESFWSPPHLLLYFSVVTAIGAGIYGWYQTREKTWQRLILLLLVVPASAPFDDFWHRTFGVEKISSPLIVWSPPHVLLIGSIIASFALLLPLIRKERNPVARQFFGAISFASILALLLFLDSPVFPIGPHHLLGFWGAVSGGSILALVLLLAQRHLTEFAPATLAIVIFLMISSMGAGERIGSGVVVPPHDHAPQWLVVFAFLISAVAVDTARSAPSWLRGGLVAFLKSAILFGFATFFFKPQFQYGSAEIMIAILAAFIGGLAVGIILGALKTASERMAVSKS